MQAAPFKIGAAVGVNLLKNNSNYRNIISKEFSSVTTENTLKWQAVHPSKDVFDFSGGDVIAQFCSTNNKRMHGHCLVWYQSIPHWVQNFTGDSLAWEQLFKDHIQKVAAHYKGKATSWDVVNEAFHDEDGSLRVQDVNANDKKDDGCLWARHLGRNYIARAFIYAHEADPNAKLFYNDYGQESNDKKTDSIVAMAQNFKAKGVPINGLGIQMHININTSKEGIVKAFQKLAATGLLIHISELDISVNPKGDSTIQFTPALAQQQAAMFAYVVQQYKNIVPAAQQYGITIWNVTDKDSWLRSFYKRKDWPVLFDDDYAKKPAYYSFKDALGE